MSDAIRDVTIRVRIEQQEARLRAPDFSQAKSELQSFGQSAQNALVPQERLRQQSAGFHDVADKVKSMDVGLQAAAASTATYTGAAGSNFQALLLTAQAESVAEKARSQSTIAQKAASIESIQGTGNALRAAAASGTFSGAVASLGQALVFSAKGAAQQSAGNLSVASSATTAGLASEFQARAIGHVSAAGSRAATANAVLNTSTAGAIGLMGRLAGVVPQVAIAVAAVSIAVEVGSQLWTAYGKAARTANDDIRDAVKQRLEAEKQSAQIEFAIADEQIRKLGLLQAAQEKLARDRERYRSTQEKVAEVEAKTVAGRLASNANDPNTQLSILNNQRFGGLESNVRGTSGDLGIRFGNGKGPIGYDDAIGAARKLSGLNFNDLGGGANTAQAEVNRLDAMKSIKALTDAQTAKEGERRNILEKSLQIELQTRDAAKSRLLTIQETIQAEQGRLQSAAERFAQMDPGEQARLKEVAIKSKGGGELTLQEAQLLSQSGIGQGQASQAFQRIANKAGFQDVAGNLGEFKQIEQLQSQGKGLSETIKATESRIQEIGELQRKSESVFEKMLATSEAFAKRILELEPRVDDLKQTFLDSKTKARASSGVGRSLQ